MAGRKQDAVWLNFDRVRPTSGKSGFRAKCKDCGKEMQGLVARLKQHHGACHAKIIELDTLNSSNMDLPKNSTLPPPPPESKQNIQNNANSMSNFVVKTSSCQKEELDLQIARYVYATNSPFSVVEHPEFKKMVNMMRPGYRPPDRFDVGEKLLNKVHDILLSECKEELKGQKVSMALDGWSNVHNESVICVIVTNRDGNCYLIDTIETVDNTHTADYLLKVTKKVIEETESRFDCRVTSLVTDSAANMSRMRKEIEADNGEFFITYGCAAHSLNLLAKDVEVPGVKDHVVHIIKYFRNHHLPASWYKLAGGKKLVLPQDVRWNTLADSLESFLRNWPILVQVCEEHRENIDKDVAKQVTNLSLKRNVEDYLQLLKPIAVALDKVQSNTCVISEAVEAWLSLYSTLKEHASRSVLEKVEKRMRQALTPNHFLAHILDPRYFGEKQSNTQINTAMSNLAEVHPSCAPSVVNLRAKANPFPSYMFSHDVLRNVRPLSWWNSLSHSLPQNVLNLAECLLTSVASSAGVERVFSTFGLVQSKIRNRLGTEKAGKLVYIYKYLNR